MLKNVAQQPWRYTGTVEQMAHLSLVPCSSSPQKAVPMYSKQQVCSHFHVFQTTSTPRVAPKLIQAHAKRHVQNQESTAPFSQTALNLR